MKTFSILGRGALSLALICLALACSKPSGLAAQNSSSAQPDLSAATSVPPAPAQNPEDKMPRINAEDAKKLFEEGKAIIIDVRGTEAYKMAHIKGALDFQLTKIEMKDFKGLPTDKKIIAYCT